MTDLMPKLTKSHGEIIFMFSIYFFKYYKNVFYVKP